MREIFRNERTWSYICCYRVAGFILTAHCVSCFCPPSSRANSCRILDAETAWHNSSFSSSVLTFYLALAKSFILLFRGLFERTWKRTHPPVDYYPLDGAGLRIFWKFTASGHRGFFSRAPTEHMVFLWRTPCSTMFPLWGAQLVKWNPFFPKYVEPVAICKHFFPDVLRRSDFTKSEEPF